MIQRIVTVSRLAFGVIVSMAFLAGVSALWNDGRQPASSVHEIATLVIWFLQLFAMAGLYALLYDATTGVAPTPARFTAGIKQYLGSYFWTTLVLGAIAYGLVIVLTLGERGLLGVAGAQLVAFVILGLTGVCFVYAVPYVYYEEGKALLPLRPALRFLAAHLRPSASLIGFVLAYTALASWGIPTLQARGVLGGFVATLAASLISAAGQAIAFIAASLVLQEHLTRGADTCGR